MVTIDRRTLLAGLVLAPAAGLLSSGTAAEAATTQVVPAADGFHTADKIDLFMIDETANLRNAWRAAGYDTSGAPVDTGWSGVRDGWAILGGQFGGFYDQRYFAAVSRTPNNLDVFAIGLDGRVYTSWWSEGATWSGFNGWRNIGGFFPRGAHLSAISQDANSLDLFVVGNDGCVYTSWWRVPNDWSGLNDNWRNLGGGDFRPGANVTAICGADGIDLFVIGNNGRVYTAHWNAFRDWTGWQDIRGDFRARGAVAVVSTTARVTTDSLVLFATGNDGHVYTQVRKSRGFPGVGGGYWPSVWRLIPGDFEPQSDVTALRREPGLIDLFMTGKDSEHGRFIYTISSLDGGRHWPAGWRSLGNDGLGFRTGFYLNAKVAAISSGPGSVQLFAHGSDRHVYTAAWWFPAGTGGAITAKEWTNIGGLGGGYYPIGIPTAITAIVRRGEVRPAPQPIILRANIAFEGATPVGGSAELVLSPDGTVKFYGHFRDSGIPSYNTSFVWGIKTSGGMALTFAHSGHVAGTAESGSRDDEWTSYGSHPAIRDLWDDLVDGTNHWEARTDLDLNATVGTVLLVLAAAGEALHGIAVIGGGAG